MHRVLCSIMPRSTAAKKIRRSDVRRLQHRGRWLDAEIHQIEADTVSIHEQCDEVDRMSPENRQQIMAKLDTQRLLLQIYGQCIRETLDDISRLKQGRPTAIEEMEACE